ncbi:2'-5' RNA ligase family protein [Amnibacterium sp. CER49]|uniref:2'-5' RNA ligase family protein n=1 Tax=Amnibacterium sp. CER49 TaxID=3039161 RepID=UPI0024490A78|nr:2'-5' RNA ligase family protein [Amnibacterium sp. CER49]MDH2444793.1 2'-5' RNA ligase family protein [Amnibacterium sp. CER49]
MTAAVLVTVNLPLVRLLPSAEVSRRAWPRHLTVLPNHAVPEAEVLPAVVAAVRAVAAGTRPIEATVRGRALFGPSRDVPVALVDRTPALADLHARLVDAVLALGAQPEAPAHLLDDWWPHVTDTAAGAVEQGAVLRLDRIAVADLRGPTAVVLAVEALTDPQD